MKFTFEKYEFGDRGRIFLGYKTVNASSNEEAHELARQGLDDNIKLSQIFVYQESQ